MSREFDLGDILSITEGSLVSPRHIEGVYDILNYMTGDNLFTHALIRASQICEPVLLAQHPDLAEVRAPLWDRSPDAEPAEVQVANWLTEMKAKYGETRTVEPLDSWHSVDPLVELAQLMSPGTEIIGVVVP